MKYYCTLTSIRFHKPPLINLFAAGFLFLGCMLASPARLLAQQSGIVEETQRKIEEEQRLREKLEKEKVAPEIEEQQPVQPSPVVPGEEKAFIETITVSGVTLLPEKAIRDIIAPFEGKELTLAQMQKVADLITDAYRQRGFVTSRAFLPPQKITQKILEIKVVEGVTGEIEVKGARFFRQSMLKKMLKMSKGQAFNVNTLRYYLSVINEHPDRNVKAVLAPGKEPGTTDIILEVKDRLPLHVETGWDNYGSRLLRKNRYTVQLKDNNLLGFDDILTFQYQLSDGEDYQLLSLRYLLPVADGIKLGFYASRSKLAMGKEFREVMARGKTKMFSVYGLFDLVNKDNCSAVFSLGFDYLDSYNFQLGDEESRDRLRKIKLGFDVDLSDSFYGRTIFSPEVDFGIAGIMGGLGARDPHASRAGAGGKFVKTTFNLARLQKMPFSSTLLWKNQIQIAPNIMTASEQFQLGGITNVRGYPNAEHVGDQGYAMTWEWTFPVYGLPQTIPAPFSKAKLYDAVRLCGFYDWAEAKLHRPQAGEEKSRTLRGAGVGLRVNLPEAFSLRLDLAWPLDKIPSDNHHLHPWVQIAKEF